MGFPWPATGGGGGIPEAPITGLYYGRRNAAWAAVTEEAPSDGNDYARNNGAWSIVVSGIADAQETHYSCRHHGGALVALECRLDLVGGTHSQSASDHHGLHGCGRAGRCRRGDTVES